MDRRSDHSTIALGPLDELLGYRLRRAWNEVRRDFEAELGPLGITRGMIGLLSVVSANPGISQGAAARVLDIQRANMVSLVAELTAAGWIFKGKDGDDRRAISLAITPEGEIMFAEALVRVKAHEARMFARLDADSRARLAAMLAVIERKSTGVS
jgi:DNA-binding MarR family transcriptional regulator